MNRLNIFPYHCGTLKNQLGIPGAELLDKSERNLSRNVVHGYPLGTPGENQVFDTCDFFNVTKNPRRRGMFCEERGKTAAGEKLPKGVLGLV